MNRDQRLLTLAEAALRLNVAPATLRAQVHREKLRAIKVGRDWLVSIDEIDRYRQESQRGALGRQASDAP